MAIQYSGGTPRNDSYPGVTTYPDLLDSIDITLVAAGWTSVPLSAYSNILYTGQPSNGNTIGLNAGVYTFRTSINNATPNEILIGSDADETYENFVAAVTGGAGSGTVYSSATSANTQFSATVVTPGTVKVYTILTGPLTSGVNVSEICDNMTWQYSRTLFGGYQWTSATTPAGLGIRVLGWIRDFVSEGPGQCRFILSDVSEVAVNPPTYRGGSAGSDINSVAYGARLGSNSATLPTSTWRVIADKYQFFAFADTIYSGGGIFVGAGVPWIPEFLYPKVIQTATTTSPVVVTTTTPHGWTTGDVVNLTGLGGIEGANGTFTITSLSTATASLDTSVGVGAYTSGGRAAKINVAVSVCGWLVNTFTNVPGTWYSQITPNDYVAQILNGSVNVPGGSIGTGTASLVLPNDARLAEGANPQPWYNTDILASEPLISMGVSDAGTSYLVGQLWDSFFHSQAETGGVVGTFDSHNWYVLTNNATGSSSDKEGALVLVVP